MKGTVSAVCISEKKGTKKHPVPTVILKKDHGIIGDAHAVDADTPVQYQHRQISLLADESADKMRELGIKLNAGDFAENILTKGINLKSLPIGTRLIIGEAELGMMKPTAFLINTARGALVDEEALYNCLKEKKIAGAALDDLASLPLQKDNKLLTLDNIVITPHMGANTFEANQRTKQMVMTNLLAGLTGELYENVVNRAGLGQYVPGAKTGTDEGPARSRKTNWRKNNGCISIKGNHPAAHHAGDGERGYGRRG